VIEPALELEERHQSIAEEIQKRRAGMGSRHGTAGV
jgi:hypothetical protein